MRWLGLIKSVASYHFSSTQAKITQHTCMVGHVKFEKKTQVVVNVFNSSAQDVKWLTDRREHTVHNITAVLKRQRTRFATSLHQKSRRINERSAEVHRTAVHLHLPHRQLKSAQSINLSSSTKLSQPYFLNPPMQGRSTGNRWVFYRKVQQRLPEQRSLRFFIQFEAWRSAVKVVAKQLHPKNKWIASPR